MTTCENREIHISVSTNEVLVEHSHTHSLSMDASLLQLQSCVETVWLTKPKKLSSRGNFELLGRYHEPSSPSLFEKKFCGEFPGGPVVRALCFHCRGQGFDPW